MSRSPTGKLSAHSKQTLKTAMQPAEPQLEEPGGSREPSKETSSEQNLDLQSEPTVTFLFTLLNTPEPKDAESDTEILEHRFLGQEDWGPKRTSAEIQNLQRDCKRLQDALNTNQRDNLDLEERLQNLPTSLYENIEETLLTPKNYRVTQMSTEVSQEEAGVTQKKAGVTQKKAEDTQEEAEDSQVKAEDTQKKAEDTREEAEDILEEAMPLRQLKRASAQQYSLEPLILLPAAALSPKGSVSQEQQSALARPEARELTPLQEAAPLVSPTLSPSNKDPH